jgi:hypothetical protein
MSEEERSYRRRPDFIPEMEECHSDRYLRKPFYDLGVGYAPFLCE